MHHMINEALSSYGEMYIVQLLACQHSTVWQYVRRGITAISSFVSMYSCPPLTTAVVIIYGKYMMYTIHTQSNTIYLYRACLYSPTCDSSTSTNCDTTAGKNTRQFSSEIFNRMLTAKSTSLGRSLRRQHVSHENCGWTFSIKIIIMYVDLSEFRT